MVGSPISTPERRRSRNRSDGSKMTPQSPEPLCVGTRSGVLGSLCAACCVRECILCSLVFSAVVQPRPTKMIIQIPKMGTKDVSQNGYGSNL